MQRRRSSIQAVTAALGCCCKDAGSGGHGSPGDVGSPPGLPPEIPVTGCCFCPSVRVPPRQMHLDWFDGCIGAASVVMGFGPGFGVTIPRCDPSLSLSGWGLQWTYTQFTPDVQPLRCKPTDQFPIGAIGCCGDFFRLVCLPGGKCFGLSFIRTRQNLGGVSSAAALSFVRVHVLSCNPFLGVFNQPADTHYNDPECDGMSFDTNGYCPPCNGVPIFGVITEV